MSRPHSTDEALAERLASQQTLWHGSNTPWASVAVYLPHLIVFGLFATVFGLFGSMIEQGNVRIGWTGRYPLGPDEVAVMRFAFTYVVPAAIMAALLVPIWRISRVRLSVVPDAIVVRDGKLSVVWPRAAIRQLHIRKMLWWRIAKFTPLSGKPAKIVLSPRRTAELIAVARSVGIALADADQQSPGGLQKGEAVLWSGRPGLGSLSMLQVSTLVVLLVPMGLFLWALIHIWSDISGFGDIGALAIALFWTLVILFVFGWTAGALAYAAYASFAGPVALAFGRLIVSDRRIAFAAPVTGRIFRDIPSSDIVGAELIEERGHRGWISVELYNRDHPDDPIYVDLKAVPDPYAALAVIGRIVRG